MTGTGFRKEAGSFTLQKCLDEVNELRIYMRKFRYSTCIKTILLFALLFVLPANSFMSCASNGVQDTGNKLVIVIDPGHGGENLGTIDGAVEEKTMTLVTATAMYEELLKYEGIQVFMTRTEDVDLSLKERAEFAQKVEADFLFSLHYNASESNELYGTEVWVSSFAPYNAYGYQFGYEFLTQMREWGLFNRGVKTRIGNKDLDYYGIIRESVALEIPALIIEHCHVDEAHDIPFCDSEEEWKAFGVADATAAAKYFGLKSQELGVDYSDYALVKVDSSAIVSQTVSDATEPEVCHIDLISADFDACTLKLSVSASDNESPLMNYSYSLDGGKTYSVKEPWPNCNTLTGRSQDNFTLTIEIPSGTKPNVIVRAYNMYDLYTESNVYESQYVFQYPIAEEVVVTPKPESEMQVEEIASVNSESLQQTPMTVWEIAKLCLVAAILILSMIVVCQLVVYRSLKLFRKRRK